MNLIRLTTPDAAHLLYEEALDHARLDEDAPQQTTIRALLAAAVEYVEAETRQTLYTSRFALHLDGFPARGEITLPRPPFQQVEAITYLSDGAVTPLPASKYTADPSGSKPGRVTFHEPPQADDRPNSVTIEFTAGHGEADDAIPHLLKQAVLLTFAHWHENREATSDRTVKDVPMAVESIVNLTRFVGEVV